MAEGTGSSITNRTNRNINQFPSQFYGYNWNQNGFMWNKHGKKKASYNRRPGSGSSNNQNLLQGKLPKPSLKPGNESSSTKNRRRVQKPNK